MSHILCNDETSQGYTLCKEDPKNIGIMGHTPWILLASAFFHWKSADFAILRNTDIDCILIHDFYFNFSWVFKDCYNEHGQNFDDVSKNS